MDALNVDNSAVKAPCQSSLYRCIYSCILY